MGYGQERRTTLISAQSDCLHVSIRSLEVVWRRKSYFIGRSNVSCWKKNTFDFTIVLYESMHVWSVSTQCHLIRWLNRNHDDIAVIRMINDCWCTTNDCWCTVNECWCTINDCWCTINDCSCTVNDYWCTINDCWCTTNDCWCTVNDC